MTSPSPIPVVINGHTWYRVEGTCLDPQNTFDERDVRACGGLRPWIVGSYSEDYARPPNRAERRSKKSRYPTRTEGEK